MKLISSKWVLSGLFPISKLLGGTKVYPNSEVVLRNSVSGMVAAIGEVLEVNSSCWLCAIAACGAIHWNCKGASIAVVAIAVGGIVLATNVRREI